MTDTVAGGGHFLLVIEMISPANATRNISSWKSSLYVTMRITSLRQGSANRLIPFGAAPWAHFTQRARVCQSPVVRAGRGQKAGRRPDQ